MTKAQELAVLDSAIQQLGSSSYLGPWLSSVRAEVESAMASDFEPTLLPSRARDEARLTLEIANGQAAEIRGNADLYAARIRNEAEDYRDRALVQLREHVGRVLARI